MAPSTSSTCTCWPCLPKQWLASRNPPAIAHDHSPQSKMPRVVQALDQGAVPLSQHACWASPAPNSPMPWGTWRRNTSEGSELDGMGAKQAVEFDLNVEQVLPSPPDGSAARRRRMREIGIAARRLERLSCAQASPPSCDFRIEQLLYSPGTLPRALSQGERRKAVHDLTERVVQELQPGATAERMAQVPRRLLTNRGPDGQRLRREIMRGAVIVFFTAGYEGKRFVYERAHALGVKSVMIESPDSWSRGLLDEGIISKFIPVDMSQSSEMVYKEALEAIRRLGEDPAIGEPDGIATVVELSVASAARLAEELALPGPSPDAVDTARDKHATRAALAAAGLPTPAHWRILQEADLAPAAKAVGFPAVLKPVAGAASLGVKKVESEKDLLETYRELDKELRSLVVSSGALVKDDGTGAGTNAESVISTCFLMERYLDGNEVDVDVVMSEGEWQYAAVSDNGPTLEPYFNETWAVSPSLLPREQQVALKELAIGSVKALGFTEGVFHVECKYTSAGPHLIEVNARMGGGPVHQTNLRTWNVDLVEETLFCAVGIPSRPAVPHQPVECIANSDVNTLRSGTLVDVSFLEPLRNREGVVSFSPHVTTGDTVVGPKDGLPTWLVEIVVSRPTPREALDFLLSLEAEVQARVKVA